MKTAAVLIAMVLLASRAIAQSTTSAPVNASTPARLSDGQPNMQGLYTRSGVKALEAEPPFNPIDPGDKNPLSVSNRGDGLGPYPRIFGEGGNVLRGQQARVQRPTGIIFPADKKLPWRPEEDGNILAKISGCSWVIPLAIGKETHSSWTPPISTAAWRIRGKYRI